MRLTIRRQDEDFAADAAHSAEVDDAIRSALFFTFAAHGVRADLLHAALERRRAAGLHRCTFTGAVEGLGVFRVWGESEEPHVAIERALHQLELWLVRERLSPRAATRLEPRPSQRAA